VQEHVEEAIAAGATLVTGGRRRPDLGSELFFEPTVLTDVRPEMRINREETFGPVVPILSFEDDEEAMALALDGEYGLSVGVFTENMNRALRFGEAIPAGIVNINDGSTYWEIHLPFGGGSGTRSGIGRLGGSVTAGLARRAAALAITWVAEDKCRDAHFLVPAREIEAMTEIKMISITRPSGSKS